MHAGFPLIPAMSGKTFFSPLLGYIAVSGPPRFKKVINAYPHVSLSLCQES
jgi:hypothetical protein